MELIEGATLAAVSEELRPSGAGTELDTGTWQKAVESACEVSQATEHALPGSQAGWPRDVGADAEVPVPRAALRVPATPGRDYVRRAVELVRQVAEPAAGAAPRPASSTATSSPTTSWCRRTGPRRS